jgi:hypothetical protein
VRIKLSFQPLALAPVHTMSLLDLEYDGSFHDKLRILRSACTSPCEEVSMQAAEEKGR